MAPIHEQKITEKFQALLKDGQNFLRGQSFNGDSEYDHRHDIAYRTFRLEAMNLIRRVCGEDSDHYQELKRIAEDEKMATNSYFFKDAFGILQAAFKDYQDGFLFDMRSLVLAEMLGDLIDQAEYLYSQNYFVAAASVAGAVLEDAMRKLCDRKSVAYNHPTTLNKLNTELAKEGVYDQTVAKRITAIAQVRNDADHGNIDKVKRDDVEDMVKYVRRFTSDWLN